MLWVRLLGKTSDFSSLDSLRSLVQKTRSPIWFSEDISPLKMPITAGRITFPNRIALQPMEAADAAIDGSPTIYTHERYLKYAEGCAGLIWFEACAVDFPEARSHDAMLVISEETLPGFKKLVADVKKRSEVSLSELGFGGRAVLVLQLSHAGRYRVKKSERSPAMAYRFSALDNPFGITEDIGRVIPDFELEGLKEAYVAAASLAFEAGFDAVDVKACHGYLLNDLLSAYTRSGRYGGWAFDERTKFFLETIAAVRKETGGSVTSRLSVYDGFPPPYGFGATMEPYPEYSPYSSLPEFDPTEPIRLIRQMKALGVDFVNISVGNPYYSQFLTRPFDVKMPGQKDSPEHPLKGVGRHFEVVETVRQEVKDMVFVGSGYSWLRQYGIYAAAYNVENSRTDLAGWGRLALAFPDFPRVTLSMGSLPKSRVCVTCSGCSRLLRAGLRSGCVIQNPGTFRESLKRVREIEK